MSTEAFWKVHPLESIVEVLWNLFQKMGAVRLELS